MKRFLFTIFLTLIFSNFFSSIYGEDTIDLTTICNDSACNPKIWYAIDNFSEDYLKSSDPVTNDWIRIEKFPIWLNKYFKKDSDLASYTLYTTIDLDETHIKSNKNQGIQFGEIGEVFSVYINGEKIAEEGKVENGKVIFHRTIRDVTYPIEKSILKEGKNSILVHIRGNPKFDHTGFYLTRNYYFGNYETLKYNAQNRIGLALILVYIVIGYYHYFLFFKRRKEKENFLFGTYCLGLSVYLVTRSSAIFEFNIDSTLIQRIELIILYPMSTMIILFHNFLFFKKLYKPNLYYLYFCSALSIPTFFVPMYFAEYILRVWQLSAFCFLLPSLIYIFYNAIKNKITNAKRLFWFFLAIIFSAVFDILDSVIFNTGIAFSKYAFFIYILGIFTVLANKFVLLHKETEELNLNLEKKVNERTLELSNTLATVQKLKRQQDGDYFLTSLLIKSLTTKDTITDHIKIRFKVKQKKQFEFQKSWSEIGGDLCRSEIIKLKDKKYTVFFNADAMGKSMQGAGGALVLGAVFDAILERTVISSLMHNQYPERWLKNAIVELHRVFESFDGSMMVSIVIGLIDNDNGLMYYFNAEHPEIVIYRDGKTDFVPDQFIYRKLGSPITGDIIEIQTFLLYPGDTIIVGSDGRDDIYLENEHGEKELNSDERLFLSTVQNNEGNLENIFKYYIENSQILSDDLSLLVVELSNDFNSELANSKKNESSKNFTKSKDLNDLMNNWNEYNLEEQRDKYFLKYFLQEFIEHKLYNFAYEAGMEFIEFDPSDIEIIYLTSYTARKSGNLTEAVELGERVRMRKVNHIMNLQNLVKSYLQLGFKEKVDIIIDLLQNLDPNNKLIKEIGGKLNIFKF